MAADETLDLRRKFLRELQKREMQLLDAVCKEPTWLAAHDEAALRWALSLARLSQIPTSREDGTEDVFDLGHASDDYRRRLFDVVEAMFKSDRVNVDTAGVQIPKIRILVRDERRRLLRLFPNLNPKDLDRATRRRPFALVLGGGGGTSYIFVGALQILEEAGLKPEIVVGSSMGSILGAFRCLDRDFHLKNVSGIIDRLSWRRVFRLFETEARFGLPATLKLYLREVIGHEFEKDGEFLRMKDLKVPFRVCVGGLSTPQDPGQLDAYAHLLDDAVGKPAVLRKRTVAIARTLQDFTQKPVKPVIIGNDDLTKEFDVLDAIGFSSAVPGAIHYDILRDDPRMVKLTQDLMDREGVFRLVDGGIADNLPAREAWNSVQGGAIRERDPFVLALDGFAPQWNRHLLFLPLMRIAQENGRAGRAMAHLTLTFKKVLSPMTVVPTQEEFRRTVENGRAETAPFVNLVRKMVGPIPDPPGVITEMDGT
ncbi:MAG: patatin-like phospholipase family protein [Deltaproteobacteria bacterium]|nr:patatin-like phospholipase family protein [Deltaproteobacteria bacterium]